MPSITIERESLVPLALLHALDGELQGKTRLQKLAFLLDEEALGDRLDAYTFRKYDYGPFSKALLEDVEALDEKDLVEITTERTVGGNTRYDYRLTTTGKEVIDAVLDRDDDTPRVFMAAEEIAAEYGDLPLRELIELVYEKFPEYTENSVYQY